MLGIIFKTMFKNEPYKKVYENGILKNPITKENPYQQIASQKKGKKLRNSNNRKGDGMVVVKTGLLSFSRYKIVQFKNRTHAILVN